MCLVFVELGLFDRVAVQASETLRVATACAYQDHSCVRHYSVHSGCRQSAKPTLGHEWGAPVIEHSSTGSGPLSESTCSPPSSFLFSFFFVLRVATKLRSLRLHPPLRSSPGLPNQPRSLSTSQIALRPQHAVYCTGVV